MSGHPLSLADLIALWLRKRQQGQTLSPEELGVLNPEQLDELKKQLRAVSEMEAFLSIHEDLVGDPALPDSEVTLDQELSPTRTVEIAPVPAGPTIPGYEILEELGRGGMGVVYKARQGSLKRLVALKMILAGSHAGPAHLQRFRAEAEAVARLQSPNIVQVYEIGEYEGLPFFTLEFVDGGNLARMLKEGPLPPRQAVDLVETVARAMQHAHEHGVIHRDLKPANILLSVGQAFQPDSLAPSNVRLESLTYTPKITDFGLAKLLDGDHGQTQSGAIMGTPAYMAPEQARGDNPAVGPAADVYSLGAILYHAVTGQPPFRGKNLMETLDQVRHQEPPPPSRVRPNLHRDLETICLKCLHKDPRRRYATAAALADDLRRFLDGEPIQARPLGLTERAWRWGRRRPTIALGLAVVAVTLLVVLPLSLANQARLDALRQDRLEAQEKTALAEKAEEAARLAATTQEYFALLNQAREGNRAARPGWTWTGLALLQKAGALATPSRNLVDLRSEAAVCLGGIDLRRRDVLLDEFVAGALAVSPDGRFLAAGKFKAQAYLSLSVMMVNLKDRHTQTLPVPVAPVIAAAGLVQDGVYSLAYSPDGRRLVAGTRSGRLVWWDLTHPRPSAEVHPAHAGPIDHLAFAPDGKTLFSAAQDRTLRSWNVATGQPVARKEFPVLVFSLAIGPQGKVLYGICDGKLYRLDMATLEPVRPASDDRGLEKLAVSPDGRALALSGPNAIELYDDERDWRYRVLKDGVVGSAHVGLVERLAFSPDGSLLVSASGDERDRKLKLWEVASGRLLAVDDAEEQGPLCPVFTPDGRGLIRAGNRQVVRDEIGGLVEQTFVASHTTSILGVGLSADGRRLACLGAAEMGGGAARGEVTLWDAVGGRFHGRHTFDAAIPGNMTRHPLALSPDGRMVAATGCGLVNVVRSWDVEAGRELPPLAGPEVMALSWQRDGRRLWADGAQLAVQSWDWPGARPASCWANHVGHWVTGRGNILAVTAGRRWVLAAVRDGSVMVFPSDATGAQEPTRTWPGGGSPGRSLALNADETTAAVGTQRGAIRLVRVPEGTVLAELKQAHADGVEALAFRRDGRLLVSGSRDGTVRLWLRNGDGIQPLLTLTAPGPVKDVALDAEGKTLLVLVHNETAVRAWHLDLLRQRWEALGWDAGDG